MFYEEDFFDPLGQDEEGVGVPEEPSEEKTEEEEEEAEEETQ